MKNKNKPIYQQAKDDILALIISNKYKVGDMIPSVREMTKSLNYTKICIQNAIKLLADEGILENIPRKGCHLKSLPPQDVKLNSFLDDNKMIKSPPVFPGTKKLKIGILSEMDNFGNSWREICLRYMTRNPRIHIELIDISSISQYKDLNEIDIMQIPSERLESFASQDVLFDIEGNNEKLELDEQKFFPNYIKACYYDDKLWGTPSSAGVRCLFYNSNYSDLLQPLNDNMQPWDYLKACNKVSKKIPAGIALNANLPISFILGLFADGKNMDPENIVLNRNFEKLKEIIHNFAPYLHNRRIFYAPPVMEDSQESRIEDCLSNRTLTMDGSSAWLYYNDWTHQDNFSWGILPPPPSPEGNGALFMHVISSSTLFPLECIEVLNYLASDEVQNFFAGNGTIVAHRQASKKLKMPGISDKFSSKLISSMDNTDVFKTNDPYYHEYIHLIFMSELFLWQKKIYTEDEFLKNLQKKTHYYYNAKRKQLQRRIMIEFEGNHSQNFGMVIPS